MIRDSGVPSIHSVTSTFGALATTRGTTISGSPAYAAAKRALRIGLERVVELLDDSRLELGEQRLDVEAGGQPPRTAGRTAPAG